VVGIRFSGERDTLNLSYDRFAQCHGFSWMSAPHERDRLECIT